MSNMGYCRFRNTLEDLRDCQDHLGDELDDKEEIRARESLIYVCRQIANDCQED